MLTPITGRSAVVTGASKGIGRGIALALARQGARVLITARDEPAARDCVTQLREAGAGEARYVIADAASSADCARVAEATIDAFGGVDILVANAGIYPESPLASLREQELRDVIDVNLTGTILTVQACLPALTESKAGRVIVISSITGPIVGMAANSHYAASKAGQVGFVRSAALELAPKGVTVNAILPGNIATEGLAALGADYERDMIAAIPQGRLGTPADIAGAVLFLASDEASFITGQTIVVDGGQVLPEA